MLYVPRVIPEKNKHRVLGSYFSKTCWEFIKYILFSSRLGIQDSGFGIEDSRFKKKSMKMHFKNKVPDFRKSKYVSTIALS